MTPTVHHEDEVCLQHMKLNNSLIAIQRDTSWIKRIGYLIIAFALGFALSVWGVFYPHLTKMTEEITRIQTQVAINTSKIMHLERTDEESKAERRELREKIQQALRGMSVQ